MKLGSAAESLYRVQEYAKRPTIDGVQMIELRRLRDESGSMIELLRLATPPGGLERFELAQINYSTLQPGVAKAFHVHRRQTDVWFVPPEDRLLLVLADVRAGSASEGRHVRVLLGDGAASLVRIPPGVAHGCRNIGTRLARIIYFTDLAFSAEPGQCDEGRLPWDLLGKEVWEVPWD
jgi:dTDP-4-dehydrorhamnose 3,5-epimerase